MLLPSSMLTESVQIIFDSLNSGNTRRHQPEVFVFLITQLGRRNDSGKGLALIKCCGDERPLRRLTAFYFVSAVLHLQPPNPQTFITTQFVFLFPPRVPSVFSCAMKLLESEFISVLGVNLTECFLPLLNFMPQINGKCLPNELIIEIYSHSFV